MKTKFEKQFIKEKLQHKKAIRKLEKEIDTRKEKLYALAKKAFPVGSITHFVKGGHLIEAEIISHGYKAHFWIQSHTGKQYSIDLYYLMKGTE